MRLSCSASAFFSSSPTSSIASCATYSTSFSLIFMCKRDFLDPRSRPRLVQFLQQLRPHPDQLLAPYLIGYVDNDARSMHSHHFGCVRQFRPNQGRPELSQYLEIQFGVPIRRFSEKRY